MNEEKDNDKWIQELAGKTAELEKQMRVRVEDSLLLQKKLTELELKIDAYRNYQNNCSYTDKLKGKIVFYKCTNPNDCKYKIPEGCTLDTHIEDCSFKKELDKTAGGNQSAGFDVHDFNNTLEIKDMVKMKEPTIDTTQKRDERIKTIEKQVEDIRNTFVMDGELTWKELIQTKIHEHRVNYQNTKAWFDKLNIKQEMLESVLLDSLDILYQCCLDDSASDTIWSEKVYKLKKQLGSEEEPKEARMEALF